MRKLIIHLLLVGSLSTSHAAPAQKQTKAQTGVRPGVLILISEDIQQKDGLARDFVNILKDRLQRKGFVVQEADVIQRNHRGGVHLSIWATPVFDKDSTQALSSISIVLAGHQKGLVYPYSPETLHSSVGEENLGAEVDRVFNRTNDYFAQNLDFITSCFVSTCDNDRQ